MGGSKGRGRCLSKEVAGPPLTVASAGSGEAHALSIYWGRWYAKADQEPRNNRTRWLSDKRNLWNGTTCVGVQPWATVKSVEAITSNDFLEFFRLFSENCEAKGNSGVETRWQYKTLIRNLFKKAKADFPTLSCPEFPAIKKSVRQKRHFTHQELEQLVRDAADLSGGAARRSLTAEEFRETALDPDEPPERSQVDGLQGS